MEQKEKTLQELLDDENFISSLDRFYNGEITEIADQSIDNLKKDFHAFAIRHNAKSDEQFLYLINKIYNIKVIN